MAAKALSKLDLGTVEFTRWSNGTFSVWIDGAGDFLEVFDRHDVPKIVEWLNGRSEGGE